MLQIRLGIRIFLLTLAFGLMTFGLYGQDRFNGGVILGLNASQIDGDNLAG